MMKIDARALAVGRSGVSYLITLPDLLGRFLQEAGAAPADVPAMVEHPDFLGAALTFLAQDEARAAAFCAAEGLTAEAFLAAQTCLARDGAHWT